MIVEKLRIKQTKSDLKDSQRDIFFLHQTSTSLARFERTPHSVESAVIGRLLFDITAF